MTKRPGRGRDYRRRPGNKVENEKTDFGGKEFLGRNNEAGDSNDEYNHYSYFNSSSNIVFYSLPWLLVIQIMLNT